MADVSNVLKEMEEQLQPPDVKEIKFLLKDTLSSKLCNEIVLNLYGYVFIDANFKISKSWIMLKNKIL